jgi:hypothetical protein
MRGPRPGDAAPAPLDEVAAAVLSLEWPRTRNDRPGGSRSIWEALDELGGRYRHCNVYEAIHTLLKGHELKSSRVYWQRSELSSRFDTAGRFALRAAAVAEQPPASSVRQELEADLVAAYVATLPHRYLREHPIGELRADVYEPTVRRIVGAKAAADVVTVAHAWAQAAANRYAANTSALDDRTTVESIAVLLPAAPTGTARSFLERVAQTASRSSSSTPTARRSGTSNSPDLGAGNGQVSCAGRAEAVCVCRVSPLGHRVEPPRPSAGGGSSVMASARPSVAQRRNLPADDFGRAPGVVVGVSPIPAGGVRVPLPHPPHVVVAGPRGACVPRTRPRRPGPGPVAATDALYRLGGRGRRRAPHRRGEHGQVSLARQHPGCEVRRGRAQPTTPRRAPWQDAERDPGTVPTGHRQYDRTDRAHRGLAR